MTAVASDGSALLQRGSHVDVVGPDRRVVKALPLGDPAPKPGVRYAVSDKARFVARIADSDVVELWDVAAGKEIGRIDTGEGSWGPPTFLGHDLIATHHTDWVSLWELPSGKLRCRLKDPAVRLPREAFAIDKGVAAVRSSANSPGINNAVLVELSTQDCRVRERHLVSARDPAQVRGSNDVRFIFSYSRLRMRSDVQTSDVTLPDVLPEALFATADGASIVWAGNDGTKAGEHVVGVWLPQAKRLVELGRIQTKSFIANVHVEGDAAYALVADGEVIRFSMPSAGDGKDAGQVMVSADQLAREEAIIKLGMDQIPAALAALGRVSAADAKAANRFLHAYIESLRTGEKGAAFRKRMKAENIAYAGASATLAAASDLAAAEVTGPALDMYAYWLEGATPGSLPESAVPLGLELALQLSEADATEARAGLLERMQKVYPKSQQLSEALKDSDE